MLLPTTITSFPPQLPHGSKRPMVLDNTRLLLSFKKPQRRSRVEVLLSKANVELVLEDTKPVTEAAMEDQRLRVNHTKTEYWVATPSNTAVTDEQLKILRSKSWTSLLAWIGPVYRLAHIQGLRGFLCPLPTALFVKIGNENPKPKVPNHKRLTSCLGKPAFKVLTKQSRYRTGYWYAERKARSAKSVYQTALELVDAFKNKKKGAIVQQVGFDLMPMIKTACTPFRIDDPLYPQQWNIARIQADYAWPNTRGKGVKVMVLDMGCELSHQDLYQSFGRNRGVSLDTMRPPGASNPGVSHGTACAGIIGAAINNRYRGQFYGIAGVAGECEIIPAALVRGSSSELLDAMEYALDQKVDVISFSHDDPKWETDELNEEIAEAAKHLVICVAAGNGGAPSVSYPAKHPDVIACGAVDKDPQDRGQEQRRQSSNHGTGLSVVAPGDNILTTFNQNDGTVGNNNEFGYISNTSAATPHVAGLAALLIGAFPNNLRGKPQDVRRIIQESAEELPGYAYTDMTVDPKGTKGWDLYTGFGLINVRRALTQAYGEFGTGTPWY